MYVETLTILHVVISLVGIGAGFVAIGALMRGQWRESWMFWFLTTTLATSLTGFLFPFRGVTPGIVVGVISTVLLGLALYGKYGAGLQGGWLKTFILTATASQYLNVFVLVVQSFQKIPVLHELAPTQSEPPFALAQLCVLGFHVWVSYRAVRKRQLLAV